MKAKDNSKMRADELAPELARLRRELFGLRTKTVTEKVEKTHQFKALRRDIARVLTRQRQLASESTKK